MTMSFVFYKKALQNLLIFNKLESSDNFYQICHKKFLKIKICKKKLASFKLLILTDSTKILIKFATIHPIPNFKKSSMSNFLKTCFRSNFTSIFEKLFIKKLFLLIP